MTERFAPDVTLKMAYRAHQAGRIDEAQAMYRGLLKAHPDYVEALYLMGLSHIQKEEFGHALPYLVQAAMHNPRDYRVRVNLAGIYRKLKADDVAAESYEQALALNPNVPEIHYNLGSVYYDRNEYELAADAFKRALELDPDNVQALVRRGRCLSHMGRIEEAAELYHQAYALRPDRVSSLAALVDLPLHLTKIDLMEAIERVSTHLSEDVGEGDGHKRRRILAFVKARAFEGIGRYHDAFEMAREANRIKIEMETLDWTASRAYNRRMLKSLRRISAPVHAGASEGDTGTTSLFILGPSRSGKTSLEKLVGSGGRVKLGYENYLVHDATRRANQFAGRLGDTDLFQLPTELYDDYTRLYLAELNEKAPGCDIFTNTMPGLLSRVGPILQTIPNARFVFVRRDVDDLALRVFFKDYRSGNAYSYRLPDVYEYLSWYHRMEDMWAKKYPEHVMLVAYEDMAANPAATLARVAELCGVAASTGDLPDIGDDRNCAEPFREMLAAHRGKKR